MKELWILLGFTILSVGSQMVYPQESPKIPQSFGDCVTPDRKTGECIFLTDCQLLSSLLSKQSLSDTERNFLTKSQCGYFTNVPLVCCPHPIRTVPVNSTIRNTVQLQSSNNMLPNPNQCAGVVSDKIFGGNRTAIGEFPFMALVEYTKAGNQKGFNCGGALINHRYVLTAAHCIIGEGIPADWSLTGVRLGEWDISTDRDCDEQDCSDPVVDVGVEEKITHQGYIPNSKNQQHDIALLRLSRDVPYTAWISPICLPRTEIMINADLRTVETHVAGWGKTENASSSSVKLKAKVDCVTLEECNAVYGQFDVTLQSTQLCAGGARGIDSCAGDSGGPLIGLYKPNNRAPYYFATGVVSFGPKPCALKGWPGVYTKVSEYIDWIESKIRP